MVQETKRLVAKDSGEHETYFKAFLNGTTLALPASDKSGNASRIDVVVWSAEHVGKRTRFGFRGVKSNVF